MSRCHKLTIPFWRRQILGPGSSVTCLDCGTKVSVPWSGMWMVIPVALAFQLGLTVDLRLVSYSLLAVGAVISLGLSSKYVPLIEK